MSFIGPESRKQLKLAARAAGAGVEFVAAIAVGYFGGRKLDDWLGTQPYCGYVGLVIGIAAGFRGLFSLARAAKSPASLPPPPADLTQANPQNQSSDSDEPS